MKRFLKFTREGKLFVGLTLFVGFAAINSGNNLLYLILGMLLALIIASGILSEVALARLRLARRFPSQIHAEEPVLVGIAVENGKRRLASYSIEVEDAPDETPGQRSCYVLKIDPRSAGHAAYVHVFSRRGLVRLCRMRVHTRFPFGLFRKSRELDVPDDVLVYPSLVPVTGPELNWVESGADAVGKRGRRGEFHGLKDYREGDDPRDIHWRKSAKSIRLVSREYDDHADRRMAVFLDNQQATEHVTAEEVDQQEEAVRRAASLATFYIRRHYAVSLVTRTVGVRAGSGPAHLQQILRALALLAFTPEQRPYLWPVRRAGDAIFVRPGEQQFHPLPREWPEQAAG